MELALKEKELVAVGISVASGCKPCTSFHVKAARRAGAPDEDILRATTVALSVRTSATEIMQSYASSVLTGASSQANGGHGAAETSRFEELVALGAAFGVNCVSSLEKHLILADAVGISKQEIVEVVKLATLVKERAASHVERLCGTSEQIRRPNSVAAQEREGAPDCPGVTQSHD